MLGRKILIAEGEEHAASVLSLKLREAGFRVVVARDEAGASASLIGERPDMVISEGGNAWWLAAEAAGVRTPVVVLTARGHEGEEKWSGDVREVVARPFSPRQVVARVKVVLGEEAA